MGIACALADQANSASVRGHPGLRVALAQTPVEDGKLEANMQRAEAAAAHAAALKVDLLNLPEAADWGWLYQQARHDALPIPGKYTRFLSELARRHVMWISAGCLEKDGDKVFNAAVIIDRTGQIVLKHRKIDTLPLLTQHLYDRGSAEDIRTIDTEFGRIGLTICADNFDLRKPQRAADQERGFSWRLTDSLPKKPNSSRIRKITRPTFARSPRTQTCGSLAPTLFWALYRAEHGKAGCTQVAPRLPGLMARQPSSPNSRTPI